MMKRSRKIMYIAIIAVLSAIHGLGMDYSSQKMKELVPYIDDVYQDATKGDNTFAIIGSASKLILETLADWPKTLSVPEKLLKAAGAAIGQFCYFSPYSLQFLEEIVLPYLRTGRLTYADFKTPYCTYQFGLKYSRDSLDPNMAATMRNGQTIIIRYHLNYSVIFNRLLKEFNGSFLLIGGGENCECEKAHRHPKETFYRVDIDNAHMPDMIIHAGYLPHLYTFPQEKFDFIWFEHCSAQELAIDHRVLEQYFRFSKPGALFLFQSNFLLPDPSFHKYFEEANLNLLSVLIANKFAILENKNYITTRKDLPQSYRQIIAMKPLLAEGARQQFTSEGPIIKIDGNACRKPTELEQEEGLRWAKILSGQLILFLPFSLEEAMGWISEQKNSKTED